MLMMIQCYSAADDSSEWDLTMKIHGSAAVTQTCIKHRYCVYAEKKTDAIIKAHC